MTPSRSVLPALWAIAIIVAGNALAHLLWGGDIEHAAARTMAMVFGVLALAAFLRVWPQPHPDDLEAGDTHQHLGDAIDLGYLADTEAASAAPLMRSSETRAQRAKRRHA